MCQKLLQTLFVFVKFLIHYCLKNRKARSFEPVARVSFTHGLNGWFILCTTVTTFQSGSETQRVCTQGLAVYLQSRGKQIHFWYEKMSTSKIYVESKKTVPILLNPQLKIGYVILVYIFLYNVNGRFCNNTLTIRRLYGSLRWYINNLHIHINNWTYTCTRYNWQQYSVLIYWQTIRIPHICLSVLLSHSLSRSSLHGVFRN